MQEWTKKDTGNPAWWIYWFAFFGLCVLLGA